VSLLFTPAAKVDETGVTVAVEKCSITGSWKTVSWLAEISAFLWTTAVFHLVSKADNGMDVGVDNIVANLCKGLKSGIRNSELKGSESKKY
jgi:hypothetical protein